jgi:hypothetical protein
LEDRALIEKESGEVIGILENWNNGRMVLGAKNFLNIIGSVTLHSTLVALNPLFQHSMIPAFHDSSIP